MRVTDHGVMLAFLFFKRKNLAFDLFRMHLEMYENEDALENY